MKKSVIVALTFMLGLACSSFAATVYVNSLATGANNGTSWDNAYTSLQSAMPGDNNTINVAEGVYKPDPSDKNKSFGLGSNVTLLGGYIAHVRASDYSGGLAFQPVNPGSQPRDPAAYRTVLSGDLNGNDVSIDTLADPCGLYRESTVSRDDNSLHVINYYTKTGIVVDGFSITGGNAVGTSGGGVWGLGTATYQNCRFYQNYAPYGGAVELGIDTANGWPPSAVAHTFTNCIFEENSAFAHGAAVQYKNTTFNNCIIRRNINVDGYGALQADNVQYLTVDNCLFDTNISLGPWSLGGAINFYNQDAGTSTMNVTNSVFVGNRQNTRGPITLTASSSSTDQFCHGVIKNCLIANNFSNWYNGGGVFVQSAPRILDVINCTITANNGRTCSGAACNTGAIMNVKNSVIWGNKSWYSNRTGFHDNSQIRSSGGTITINYSCIDTSDPNTYVDPAGVGNIFVNPQIAAADPKYNVQATSPTIDAGDPADDWSKEPKCTGERINMGWTGGTATATPKVVAAAFDQAGDVNCDGNVDLADFSKLASEWLQ
jgi:hypothetical protein